MFIEAAHCMHVSQNVQRNQCKFFDVLMFEVYAQFVLEYCPTVLNLQTPARQYSSLSDQLKNVQRGSTSCVFCLCKFDANYVYLQILDCHRLQSLEHCRFYSDMIIQYNNMYRYISVPETFIVQ